MKDESESLTIGCDSPLLLEFHSEWKYYLFVCVGGGGGGGRWSRGKSRKNQSL